MRWLLVIASVVAGGCRYTGTYACERDDQCRSRAAPGTCQLPAGVCSFLDATCPMGQRYDDTAGDVAGECVAGTPMIDAAVVFDPMSCPTSFIAITVTILSRYRVLPALAGTLRFPAYMAACEAEKPGFTHAVVIDSPEEAMALATVLGSTAGQHYIGAIQNSAQTQPADGWINADGSMLIATRWAVSQGEPDDENGTEADHYEQAGAFNGAGIYDVPGRAPLPVICECDGKAVSPTFQAVVAATPFN